MRGRTGWILVVGISLMAGFASAGQDAAAASEKSLAAGEKTGSAQVDVQTLELENGMRFLLVPRPELTTVSGGWVAHVGSANERPGITGLAHLFEHMLFKGSRTIGSKDIDRDLEIIERQEALQKEIRRLYTARRQRWRRGEIEDPYADDSRSPELIELRQQFEKLVEEQREIILKDEFDRLYTEAGGSGMNAFTTQDMTVYFVTVPANKLELWFWMESDRLNEPVFREFYSERSVVHEERRRSTESTPTGKFEEQLEAMFWQSHPYSWPVLGWPSDLEVISKEQADKFFATHYAPNNLTEVLVGNFEIDEARRLARRYFGRLKRGTDPPEVVTLEMEQQAEKRMVARCNCQPRVQILYHTVPFRHGDSYALSVLAGILNGRTGRLYKSMVLDRQIATSAGVYQNSNKYGGAFGVDIEAKGEVTPGQLEAAWYQELAKLQGELVAPAELKKIKNRTAASAFRRLRKPMSLLIQLLYYDGLGDWTYLNDWARKTRQVTAEEVREVARRYFAPQNRLVGLYYRNEAPPASQGDAGQPKEKGNTGPPAPATSQAPTTQSAPSTAPAPAQSGQAASRAPAAMTLNAQGPKATVPAQTDVANSKEPPLPAHPRELEFGPLDFEVPDAKEFRHTLSNGIPVYVVEDHSLPLVTISVTLRSGSFLEPPHKIGLASLTGSMLREGGTESLTAEEFDERVDFIAANMGSFIDDTSGGGSMDCLSWVLDDALELFFDMLRRPRFQQDRLDVEKSSIIEGLRQRNDDARSIFGREWLWLLYGQDHFSTRLPTQASIEKITRQDLLDFHLRAFQADHLVIAVAGDVDPESIMEKLEKQVAGWGAATASIPWPPPILSHKPKPGLYHVEKDVPQGRVGIGHMGIQLVDWKNPDLAPILVMNDILGGGGFTSRITKRVRSDEGLAYSAYSVFGMSQHWPGVFRIGFQSKSATVAYAAKLALQEVRRIQTEPVTPQELGTSKNSFIDVFPRRFESAVSVATLFAADEFLGRGHDYWDTYQNRLAGVTADDVLRIAKTYLHPERIVFLVIGRWAEIEPGDAEGKASMKEFFDGKVSHLPLRDPLTLEPM